MCAELERNPISGAAVCGACHPNRCLGAPSIMELGKAYRSHRPINLWGQRNTLHMYTAGDWDLVCDVYHDRGYPSNHISSHSCFFNEIMEQVQAATAAGKLFKRAQVDVLVKARSPETLAENEFLTYMVQGYLCANRLLFGIPAKPNIRRFACFSALGREQWQWSSQRFATSLEKLLFRYFRYYGPATIQDFSHCSGLPIAATRGF